MGPSRRVLMISTHFYPTIGGAERQALALGRALVTRGHSVSVVTHRPRGLPASEVVDGVSIHRAIRPIGRGGLYALSYCSTLAAFLLRRRRDYDLIHAHLLFLDAAAAGLLRSGLGKPVVAKAAGAGATGDAARLRRVRFGSRLLRGVARADRIVAPSRDVEEELVALGISRTQLIRIPNGVETERFRPTEDREAARQHLGLTGRLVSFTGRLDPHKGVDVLLDAWQRVASAVADATLLVVGKGPQEEALRRQAARLDLSGRVIFVGERPDVLPYLHASELFVFPSRFEGLPNALLEAMACGLPCVASRIGAHAELITDGADGVLVDPRDPNRLAEAMLRVLRNTDEAARLGRAARHTIERGYAMPAVAGRYEALYEELLR